MDVVEDIRKNGLFNYLKRGYGIGFVKSVKNFFNASKSKPCLCYKHIILEFEETE